MSAKSRRVVKTLMKSMRIAYAILGNDMGYVKEDRFTKVAKYSRLIQCCLLSVFAVFVSIYASIFGFPPFTSWSTLFQLSIPVSSICILLFDATHHNYSLKFFKQLYEVKHDLTKFKKYIDTSRINYFLLFYQIFGLIKAFTHIFNYISFSLTRIISLPMFFVIWFLSQPSISIMLIIHCCSLMVFHSYYKALNEVCSVLNEIKFKVDIQMDVIDIVGRNHVKLTKALNDILRKQKWFVKYFFTISMARVLIIEHLFIVLSKRNHDDLGVGFFLDLLDVTFNNLFTVFCIAYAYEKVNAEVSDSTIST